MQRSRLSKLHHDSGAISEYAIVLVNIIGISILALILIGASISGLFGDAEGGLRSDENSSQQRMQQPAGSMSGETPPPGGSSGGNTQGASNWISDGGTRGEGGGNYDGGTRGQGDPGVHCEPGRACANGGEVGPNSQGTNEP